MSKKKTQIDRVVEGLDAEIVKVRQENAAKIDGLQSAINKLREQKVRAPKRAPRPVAVALPVAN